MFVKQNTPTRLKTAWAAAASGGVIFINLNLVLGDALASGGVSFINLAFLVSVRRPPAASFHQFCPVKSASELEEQAGMSEHLQKPLPPLAPTLPFPIQLTTGFKPLAYRTRPSTSKGTAH